jgi:hypothetical protein
MPNPFFHRAYVQLVSLETFDDPDRRASEQGGVHRSTGCVEGRSQNRHSRLDL